MTERPKGRAGRRGSRTAVPLVLLALALAVLGIGGSAAQAPLGQGPLGQGPPGQAPAAQPGAEIPGAPGITVHLRPGLEREGVAAALEALAASGRPVTLRWEGGPAGPAASGAAGRSRGLGEAFELGLAARLRGLARLGEVPTRIAAAWRAGPNGDVATAGLRLAAALIVAAGLALGLRRAWPAPRLAAAPESGTILDRLGWTLPRLARDLATAVLFAASAWMLARLLLPAGDLAQFVGARAARDLGMVALFAAFARTLLAPDAPGQRLLRLPRAGWHLRMVLAYAALGAMAEFGLGVTGRVVAGQAAAQEIAEGVFLVIATVLTVFKLAWFFLGRQDLATLLRGRADGASPHSARALASAAVPWLLIAVALLLWCAGIVASADPERAGLGTAAGATQIAAILVPLAALLIDEGVATLAARRAGAAPATPLRAAVAAGLRRVLAAGLLLGGLYAVARLWTLLLADPEIALGLGAAVRIAAALSAGWVAWGFLRAYAEAHLPAAVPGLPGEDEPGEPRVASRLTTVLPILRDLAFGAVLAATALAALSGLGVDVGPLLAGFGVVGLAISFGSQALVKDVVSGIFFLADDAFRIGEYIDTGKLKGTVERITLRSVQLRHQNGPVHTIPFGTLSQVTNASRDWATVKFTLRLDRAVDLDAARKVIKKVGQAMLEDPEVGPDFLGPLKMQGVHEIADSAVVVRCKFTAKPTRPSFVQREALRRIRAALGAAGIEFASSAVSIRQDGPGAIPRETVAAAAAAGPAALDPAPRPA